MKAPVRYICGANCVYIAATDGGEPKAVCSVLNVLMETKVRGRPHRLLRWLTKDEDYLFEMFWLMPLDASPAKIRRTLIKDGGLRVAPGMEKHLVAYLKQETDLLVQPDRLVGLTTITVRVATDDTPMYVGPPGKEKARKWRKTRPS